MFIYLYTCHYPTSCSLFMRELPLLAHVLKGGGCSFPFTAILGEDDEEERERESLTLGCKVHRCS